MSSQSIGATVPESYDDYYLQVVKTAVRYGCPIASALSLAGFALDWFTISRNDVLKSSLLRLAVPIVLMTFWWIAPRLRSLRTTMLILWSMYIFVLIDFISMMPLFDPPGLIYGQPTLLLIAMCAASIFCLKPVPAACGGLIGVVMFVVTCISAKMRPVEIFVGTGQFAAGVLVSSAFLVILDRELKLRHSIERSLEAERERSESLLKEILPRYVIQRIRDGAESIADMVSEVNVIFIDIVGFTAMCKRLAPKHLLEVLGETFQLFDERCAAHGVTKVKTIGDAYMAMTGLPESSNPSAVEAVEFCQDALRSVEAMAQRTGLPINVRVGVATGSVISGVLSLNRPAYDLWGDTVNLAARMQTNCEPGRIHISETTYWRVKSRFECEPRGVIDIKGIGPLQTYFICK